MNSIFGIFYLNQTVWFSCLKTWVDACNVSWQRENVMGVSLGFYFNFMKRKVNDKVCICVKSDVTQKGYCDQSWWKVMKGWGRGGGDFSAWKNGSLPWLNSCTASYSVSTPRSVFSDNLRDRFLRNITFVNSIFFQKRT